jgi:hypothetical protein
LDGLEEANELNLLIPLAADSFSFCFSLYLLAISCIFFGIMFLSMLNTFELFEFSRPKEEQERSLFSFSSSST